MLYTIQFRVVLSFRLSEKVKIKIHKTVILSVVFYGCETCSFTLREEHRLRVCEGAEEKFRSKRKKIQEEGKKLKRVELHLYYWGYKNKDAEVGGACGTHGGNENCVPNFSR
jgi:hypothetical protein